MKSKNSASCLAPGTSDRRIIWINVESWTQPLHGAFISKAMNISVEDEIGLAISETASTCRMGLRCSMRQGLAAENPNRILLLSTEYIVILFFNSDNPDRARFHSPDVEPTGAQEKAIIW